MRVVIAGVSTRAAAESAARAGFDVTAIDAFADADQHPSVRAISIRRPFTPNRAALAAKEFECDAAVYLSNFENYPDQVRTLTRGRTLWGNPPDVLRRVRDPKCLALALKRRGIASPMVRLAADRPDWQTDWLVKPLASGGGHGVRSWREDESIPKDSYLQERIDGMPGSIAFVAANRRAVVLGVCRQLIGESVFGADAYRYCGSMLKAGADASVVRAATMLAEAVSSEFDLAGVNGIDFIEGAGQRYVIEVNPRWTASMELVERAHGLSMFGIHANACAHGELPSFDCVRESASTRVIGKAIVFARDAVTIGDTRGWLADADVRDVPHPGGRISGGQPVCTVFAEAANENECFANLVQRATAIYARIAAW
jgi:uncharacterized protein